MRNELKHIEEIENYLLGKCTVAEKLAFEQRMQNDPALAEDVSLQRKITERIALTAFIADVKSFHPDIALKSSLTQGGSWFLNSIIAMVVTGAAVLGYFVYQSYQHDSTNESKEKIEQTEQSGLAQKPTETPQETVHFTSSTTPPIAETTNNTTTTNQAQHPNSSRKPIVKIDSTASEQAENTNSLFEKLQVDYEEITMDADEDKVIITKSSRSKIMIPGGIMVYEDGTPVRGKVTIKYREFRNPADMAFSAIPMKHQEENSEYNFNSAGMIEIRAYQEESELKIGKEKAFTLDYNVTERLDSCYFWSLNDQSQKWDKLHSLNYGVVNNPIHESEEAAETTNQNPEDEKKPAYDAGFVYGKIKSVTVDSMIPEYIIKFVSKEMATKKIDIQATDSGYIAPNFYPGNYMAVVSAPGYHSYTIENVEVKSDQLTQLDVKLKPVKIRNHAWYYFGFGKGKERRSYNRSLKDVKAYAEAPTYCELAESLKNLVMHKVDDIDEEKSKTYYEKPEIVIEKPNSNYVAATQNLSKTVYGLRCAGFGVYNCDQVKRMKNPKRISASFLSSAFELSSKTPKYMVLIDRSLNASFTFLTNEITFDQNSQNVLLVYSANKIYFVSDDAFISGINSGFAVREVTDELETLEDLHNLLQPNLPK